MTLHSRWSCTEMIDTIATTMRQDLVNEITKNNKKIAIIIDEATSTAKDSCLVVYIGSNINGSAVSITELSGQDANSVCKSLLDLQESNGIDDKYLERNLIAFTSDGASLMMGAIKGVGTILKSKYPQIALWHCLNHRLELAVSDTINAVGGTQPIKDFFCKIYTIYSQSAKMQRDLKIIAAEIDVQLRKVDKILTTRWVASSSRAVESFWRNYPALYKHFPKLSQSNDKHKATYAGLAKRMKTIEFVEDVAIMKDCLGQLSILSESPQKNCTTLLKASDNLEWTINALGKIKDSLETKYEFKTIYDFSADFKGVELKPFQSRNGYNPFNRKQFLQGLIDNLQRRMIDSSEEILLNQIESLCPEKWPRGETVLRIKGEKDVVALCERFKINTANILRRIKNILVILETFLLLFILSNELDMYKVAL